MFIGSYSHSVDDKGRLIMPARFREGLCGSLHITIGLDDCLVVYNDKEWNALAKKINDLPFTNKAARHLSRSFLGNSAEIELDKQGRILIAQNLRELAGIGRDVVLIGIGEQIEIWDRDKWLDTSDKVDADDFEASLESLGI